MSASNWHESNHPNSAGSGRMLVGFDADDTLWHCEREFVDIQTRFAAMLAPWMSGDTDAHAHLDAIERRNLEVFGYGVKGFVLSMIESAIMLSDGAVGSDEIQQIIDWGKDLLNAGGRGLELIEWVVPTVSSLAHMGLIVVTKGDLFEQESKFAASGLAEFFHAVEVVPEKTPDTFRRVLERHNTPPERFVFVGNSVKSDILPVLELGGYAIFVPYPLVWAHEDAELPRDHERLAVAESMADVAELISQIGAPIPGSTETLRQ